MVAFEPVIRERLDGFDSLFGPRRSSRAPDPERFGDELRRAAFALYPPQRRLNPAELDPVFRYLIVGRDKEGVRSWSATVDISSAEEWLQDWGFWGFGRFRRIPMGVVDLRCQHGPARCELPAIIEPGRVVLTGLPRGPLGHLLGQRR